MLLRKRRKVIDSLMAFYHIASTIYTDSEKFEEDDVKGLMINAHLNYLFGFHKNIADKHKIPIPKVKKLFDKYISKYNKMIGENESSLQDILEELSCRKSRSYII